MFVFVKILQCTITEETKVGKLVSMTDNLNCATYSLEYIFTNRHYNETSRKNHEELGDKRYRPLPGDFDGRERGRMDTLSFLAVHLLEEVRVISEFFISLDILL